MDGKAEKPLTLVVASALEGFGSLFNFLFFFGIYEFVEFISVLPVPGVQTELISSVLLGVFSQLVFFAWGIICFIAAYGLWNGKKYGGILGFIEASLSLVGGFFSSTAFSENVVLSVLNNIPMAIYNIVTIILIVLSWKYLK